MPTLPCSTRLSARIVDSIKGIVLELDTTQWPWHPSVSYSSYSPLIE